MKYLYNITADSAVYEASVSQIEIGLVAFPICLHLRQRWVSNGERHHKSHGKQQEKERGGGGSQEEGMDKEREKL